MSFADFLRVGRRFSPALALSKSAIAWICVAALMHLAALLVLAVTEVGVVPKLVFLCTWGLMNCVVLAFARRPAFAATLALALLVALVILSRFKFDVLWMTANFIDVLILDFDTLAYVLAVVPGLTWKLVLTVALVVPAIAWVGFADPLRLPRRIALAGAPLCLAGIVALALAFPQQPWEIYFGDSYVSKFSRSGVTAVSELMTHGYLESDAAVAEQLRTTPAVACAPAGRLPHIVMVHDESSFDITAVNGIKVPAGYGGHFKSFDGKQRSFVVEGAGGPSWYTEYNVFAGLSARSFGNFAYFVTRIAAGRVQRGLAQSLARCGYKTQSLYPSLGAFMGAKAFQTGTGMQNFYDSTALGSRKIEPDSFYFDHALRLIENERGSGPLFTFVYLAANHYPWNHTYRPELLPGWRATGNDPQVDEYLRRQAMSFRDYAAFVDGLKRRFPGESFLIVRFGDHQPDLAGEIIEPGLSQAELARRFQAFDLRYFTTYYAIDTINFRPADLSSALDMLDAPYLPIVVQEAAGVPLDPSFTEQKKILQRCQGAFYRCKDGAEARRFNRLLIDAGLIKGL